VASIPSSASTKAVDGFWRPDLASAGGRELLHDDFFRLLWLGFGQALDQAGLDSTHVCAQLTKARALAFSHKIRDPDSCQT